MGLCVERKSHPVGVKEMTWCGEKTKKKGCGVHSVNFFCGPRCGEKITPIRCKEMTWCGERKKGCGVHSVKKICCGPRCGEKITYLVVLIDAASGFNCRLYYEAHSIKKIVVGLSVEIKPHLVGLKR